LLIKPRLPGINEQLRKVMVTYDPSALMRMAVEDDKCRAFEELVEDLKGAARVAAS